MGNNIILNESPGELRRMARWVLKDNWVDVSIGLFIYLLLSSGIAVLLQSIPIMQYIYTDPNTGLQFSYSGITNIYNFLTNGALRLGLAAYLMSFMRTRQDKKDLLFYGFTVFIEAFLLGFLVNLFTGLWMMLFVIPGIIAIYRYSQAFYIKFDNPQLGALDCIRASKFMTQGNKGAIFLTHLTFIGWAIVASFAESLFDTVISVSGLSMNPVLHWAIKMILMIPMAVFYIYLETTNIVMYEIMSGHLYRQAPPQYQSFQAQAFSQNGYHDPNNPNNPNDNNPYTGV